VHKTEIQEGKEMKPYKIRENLVNLFRDNLTDPNSYRRDKQKNWIYGDFPKPSATMPRIGVTLISSPMTTLGANTEARYQDIRYEVALMLNRTHKYDIDGENDCSPEETASHLSHEISKLVLNNEDSYKEQGLLYLKPTDESPHADPKENIMYRTIELTGNNIRRFNSI